jgi:hypothetical protein
MDSCASRIPLHSFEEEIPKASPDYTNINHWIAHPDKFDNSEILPENVINDTFKLDSIDVFFVYPTLYFDGLEWNSEIENKKLNKKIENLVLKNQANIFSGMADIYSPIYRQMHIHGYKDNNNGIKAFDVAYQDVEKAFKYYLNNFHKGNRIVLAGHSQGTHLLQKLFTDYLFKNDSILQKIELSYLIGDLSIRSFSTDKFTMCETPTDLNCYLSWNSHPYGKEIAAFNDQNIPVTNPITFRKNEDASLYNMHQGILISSFKFLHRKSKLRHPKVLSAKCNNGLLWVELESFPLWKVYKKLLNNNYHALDYNFFWMNIRENFYQRMRKK